MLMAFPLALEVMKVFVFCMERLSMIGEVRFDRLNEILIKIKEVLSGLMNIREENIFETFACS
uniref:Uncharacterized protein n=1 Tax=Salix viminalis TaxID=40686 RepID=A0A6N2KMZ8_SALVM